MLAFLENAAIYIIPFLAIITVIVTIHELGHFLVARACGVAVDRFSVGFGPTLWARRDRWGVEWRVAWLPLGGYVRFAGDDNAASIPDAEDLEELRQQVLASEGPNALKRYFYFKPLWQRALVVLAGPMANFLLAIVVFALIFATVGEPVTKGPIAEIIPASPAAAAGFRTGDVIVAADGHTIRGFEDLKSYVSYRDGDAIDFTVLRGGAQTHLVATPRSGMDNTVFGPVRMGHLGVSYGRVTPQIVHYDPLSALVRGAGRTWDSIVTTALSFERLITGRLGLDQLHGVIGMAKYSGVITQQSIKDAGPNPGDQVLYTLINLLDFGAVLSVLIGLANLMPIPVLDGGHLLFYAWEGVVRRPLSAGAQMAGYRVGLALLVCLLLVANGNDLVRLVGGLFS